MERKSGPPMSERPRRVGREEFRGSPTKSTRSSLIDLENRFSPLLENSDTELHEEEEDIISLHSKKSKECDFQITDEMLDELPWHHIQLYQLYGQEADDFLHPKIDQEILNQFVKPKRHNHIKLDGVTAEELWDKLRNDSTFRLLRKDRRIKQELKAAYSAFLRQCAQQNKTPVKRNFYDVDDVPEIDLLMDHSVSAAVQAYTLKCQLMYRSSVNNENKAGILHHNNPYPNLNDIEGHETIERYLPSWWDGVQSDTVSHKTYEKWIRSPNESPVISSRCNSGTESTKDISSRNSSRKSSIIQQDDSVESPIPSRHSAAMVQARKQDQEDWNKIILPRKYKNTIPPLRFLTEKDTTCKGQFRERNKELAESRNIPKPFVGVVDNAGGDQPMNKVLTARQQPKSPASSRSMRCKSEPVLSAEEYNKHFETTWEPLTHNALVEYKQWVDTMGNGDFSFGKAKTWSSTKA